MSLHLDARQRAMLQEMGVTVWAQPEAAPPPVIAPVVAPRVAAVDSPSAPPRPQRPAADRAATPAVTPPAPVAAAQSAPAWRLHAPQALYPTADPAQTPAGLGGGWLIVAESPTPTDPLAGEAGKLLDNMLRALQLHRHPRVFFTALERSARGAPGGTDVAAMLADTVARLQPALVLVLGHVAARAALARTEPLGQLRTEPHELAGCPAVVTYDPAVLLRSKEPHTTKAATWADLCRALALVRGSVHNTGG